ncbi:MAG TPA: YiiX/YebB-like N1pC/P60 family cysteine hydrolase, partial [Paludibacteraceae bacterium]|nr:YiiX/YebB-like N1pC/P60 family cysteine hydrolase [Paludibacteraceae bacterium]
MDKKIVFFLSFCTLLASCNIPVDNFKLRDGDLLFSVGKGESELLKAIQNATSKDGEIPFSHVGIACIENDSVFVLEAAPKQGVVKTPLADFIDESAKIDSKPIVAVGRMKKVHEKSAKEAP